jgi:hypothetical protein
MKIMKSITKLRKMFSTFWEMAFMRARRMAAIYLGKFCASLSVALA